MKSQTTLWVAIAMITVGLAGCTGGGGELDMLVTPADDPVTQPFKFEATGPKYDHYEWDFSDGTPVAEGAEAEHVFGFTNGDVIVRLTAHNEGDEANAVTIARTVDLGGSPNINPDGVMTTSSFWVDPGEPFAISAAGSSDPDGDPLLYRWSVERVRELIPPDTSHPPHEGVGALPFGVDAWADLDPNLTMDGTDYGDSMATDLSADTLRPWSATEDAIMGSITESGAYSIELFVRDPKGTPWVGRANVYVSEPDRLKPNATYTLTASGTFQSGSGGSFQAFYEGDNQPEELPMTLEDAGGEQSFDRVQTQFAVPISILSGNIDFSYSGGTSDAEGVVQYRITDLEGNAVIATSSESRTLDKDALKNSPDGSIREYILEFTLTQGADVSFEFEMAMESDMDPLNWYERI